MIIIFQMWRRKSSLQLMKLRSLEKSLWSAWDLKGWSVEANIKQNWCYILIYLKTVPHMLYLLFAFLCYMFKKTRKIKYLQYNCNLVLNRYFLFYFVFWIGIGIMKLRGRSRLCRPSVWEICRSGPFRHQIIVN